MIINRDTKPEVYLYYLGSITLELLVSSKAKEAELLDLFGMVREVESVSFDLFAQVLDWLFIAGLVGYSRESRITLCF